MNRIKFKKVTLKRNYALIQLMVQTGLRISEAAAVRMADLTIRERFGSIRVCDAKGRKEREVPLNAAARRALTAYLSTSSSKNSDAHLFFSKRNQPASIRTLQDTIARLARRAHIKRIKVSAHTLRHYTESRTMPSHHISSLEYG
jgi:integrase/recombinase XerC